MTGKRNPSWSIAAAVAAVLLTTALPGAARAAGCDEYNRASPWRSARITLDGAEVTDETRQELRSFVETGSLGPVEVSVVSGRGLPVGSVTAVPHLSRISPNYGEQLKGIEISAVLPHAVRNPRIVVQVRQLCARFFRGSFLYY